MEGYHEEEHCQKLQEEEDLQDALANTEHNAEMSGKGSTWTVQDSTEAGTPLVTTAVPPPLRCWTMASNQDPLMLISQSLKSHLQTPIST